MGRRKTVFNTSTSIDNQSKKIVEDISKIFKREGQNIVSLNLKELINQLEQIQKEVIIIDKTFKNKKNEVQIIHTIKGSIKIRQLLVKGYLILQNFRAYLTKNIVDYRVYGEIINKGNIEIGMISLTEEDLIKYLTVRSNHGIEESFNLGKINKTLLKQTKHSIAEINFLNHFTNLYNSILTKDMQPSFAQGQFMATKNTVNFYGDNDSKTPPNLFKQDGRYKSFTRGHIIEGLDISLYEDSGIQTGMPIYIDYANVKRLFFTKNLNYDSVSGFKGGDNPFTNTQIKSIGADLMDYSTIKKQIELLYNNISNVSTQTALEELLTQQFMDNTSKTININIDNIINKEILSDLMKQIRQLKEN